jgi:hypothetical protein
MKTLIGLLLAGAVLTGGTLASANPVAHTARAAGNEVKKGWHKAAHGAQVVAAHNSHSRHRRRYHLRKAATHAAIARKSGHRAAAHMHAAEHGH